MRTILKWLLRILLAFVLAAVAVGIWKREEISRLLAVNSLFAEEKIVTNFSHMNGAFLTTPVGRGDMPVPPSRYRQNAEERAGCLPVGAAGVFSRSRRTAGVRCRWN